jgi:hypothetical protein
VGVEGYGLIAPNLYLGIEVGYANPDGRVSGFAYDIDTEMLLLPQVS